jgi:hypothetical protein
MLYISTSGLTNWRKKPSECGSVMDDCHNSSRASEYIQEVEDAAVSAWLDGSTHKGFGNDQSTAPYKLGLLAVAIGSSSIAPPIQVSSLMLRRKTRACAAPTTRLRKMISVTTWRDVWSL